MSSVLQIKGLCQCIYKKSLGLAFAYENKGKSAYLFLKHFMFVNLFLICHVHNSISGKV